MATNPYFNSQFSTDATLDGSLYQDLIDEMIQVKGRDLYYLPRTLRNFDSYFGEDRLPSAFNDVAVIEMYLENVEAWQGEGHYLSKFGLELRDQATLIVSKRRFQEEVTTQFSEVVRPREGDVLVLPQTYDNRLRAWEITFVDNETPFYQLGNLPSYRITIKNFEYSGEVFDTGVPGIDDYEQQWGLMTVLTLGVGSGTYSEGEVVRTPSWSADVVEYAHPELIVMNVTGELIDGDTIVGDVSGASYVYTATQTEVENDAMMNDNETIENADLVDDTEHNPFLG